MSKAPKKPDAKKSKDVKGKTVSAEKQQNTTYLEIVPFTINEAKKAILHLIDVIYLSF